MDEFSYNSALDSIYFSNDNLKAHYYDTDQDRKGDYLGFFLTVYLLFLLRAS